MEQSNDFNTTMDRFYQLFSDLIEENSEKNKDTESID